MRGGWTCVPIVLALAAACARSGAAARPEAEPAPAAADTGVRVPVRSIAVGGDDCGVVGTFVLDGPEALARLRQYPQCRDVPDLELADRVIVGVQVGLDCNARYAFAAYRVDAERVVRAVLYSRYGGCRAMRWRDHWLELPRPPAGYRIEVTRRERPAPNHGADRFAPDSVLDALGAFPIGGP